MNKVTIFLFFICLLAQAMSSEILNKEWRVMESRDKSNNNNSGGRNYLRATAMNSFMKQKKADANKLITLTFAIYQKNIDDIALSIADPKSPNYGKHLTKEEVTKLTQNVEGEMAVKAYLQENGIEHVHELSTGSYISAEAPVSVWEKLLNTEFFEYSNTERGETLTRTEQYSLPSYLSSQVQTVLNTVQFPAPMHSGPRMTPMVGKPFKAEINFPIGGDPPSEDGPVLAIPPPSSGTEARLKLQTAEDGTDDSTTTTTPPPPPPVPFLPPSEGEDTSSGSTDSAASVSTQGKVGNRENIPIHTGPVIEPFPPGNK